jgi:hypothetical protein
MHPVFLSMFSTGSLSSLTCILVCIDIFKESNTYNSVNLRHLRIHTVNVKSKFRCWSSCTRACIHAFDPFDNVANLLSWKSDAEEFSVTETPKSRCILVCVLRNDLAYEFSFTVERLRRQFEKSHRKRLKD